MYYICVCLRWALLTGTFRLSRITAVTSCEKLGPTLGLMSCIRESTCGLLLHVSETSMSVTVFFSYCCRDAVPSRPAIITSEYFTDGISLKQTEFEFLWDKLNSNFLETEFADFFKLLCLVICSPLDFCSGHVLKFVYNFATGRVRVLFSATAWRLFTFFVLKSFHTLQSGIVNLFTISCEICSQLALKWCVPSIGSRVLC